MHEIRVCKPETGRNVIYLNDNMLDTSFYEVIRKTILWGLFSFQTCCYALWLGMIPRIVTKLDLSNKSSILKNYLRTIFVGKTVEVVCI